jgi:hypothetical protein
MRIMVCLAAAVTGACGLDPDPSSDLAGSPGGAWISYSITDPDKDPCGVDVCGNSVPELDEIEFLALDVGTVPGRPNPEGVRIIGVHDKDGVPMRLELAGGDRLRGVDPATGSVISEGPSLVDTRIKVAVNGKLYKIRIGAAAPTERFWAGARSLIWAYELYYHQLAGDPQPERPLCSAGSGRPDLVGAVVFGGDLYDRATGAITVGPATNGWMNIACAGGAIYKMHKTGHTSAAQARLGIATTVAQRRAMLNAWTLNVCGTGEAFTRKVEFRLRDSLGVFSAAPYDAPMRSREAIWDQDGAVCLDTDWLEKFDPGIHAKLRMACGDAVPPSCRGLRGDWTARGHVLTGNP